MYCRNCGREISDIAYVCPNCGVLVNGSPTVGKKTNTLSIVGFILAFFVPIAGLVCSIIARKQIHANNEGGAGLALAGLIISIVEIALTVISTMIGIIVSINYINNFFAEIIPMLP